MRKVEIHKHLYKHTIHNHQRGGALAVGQDRILGLKYAIFAEASYYFNDAKQKILDKYAKPNWDIVQDLTTNDASTFRNRITQEVVVAIRGTDFSNVNDVLTDVAIVGGVVTWTPRYSVIKNIVSKAIQKYGRKNITLTGHSLGGKLAIEAGNEFGLPVYVFNAATGPLDFFARRNKNVKFYTTNINKSRDIVSFLGTLYNKYNNLEFRQEALDPHTLKNFLPTNAQELAQTGNGKKNKNLSLIR
jgi:hypothetical protein